MVGGEIIVFEGIGKQKKNVPVFCTCPIGEAGIVFSFYKVKTKHDPFSY